MSTIRVDDAVAALTGALTLETLMVFRKAVIADLPADIDMTIDLSDLDARDSSVLALLIFIVRRAAGEGSSVTFTGVDPRVAHMADLAGVRELLFS